MPSMLSSVQKHLEPPILIQSAFEYTQDPVPARTEARQNSLLG